MNNLLLWIRVIRSHTLFASLCPVLIGLFVANSVNVPIGIFTAICAMSLQVLSNLINDYYDFKRGTDKAGRKGFKRALAEGEVSIDQIKHAIFITIGIALSTGLGLLIYSGIIPGEGFRVVYCLPILIIGLTAFLFAWLYTATDHSLSYLGIADIFVFLYYGVIASTGTTYLQTHTFSTTSFWAGGVCGLISMCILIANNLRDIEEDRAVGKKTFPVRFGKRAGEIGMLIVVLLMPVLAYLAYGWSLPMFIIIPGLLLFIATLRAKGAQYNKCLLGAVLLNILYVILAAITLFI
ncbi:MAG: 1,4-dihydroxy-2-naphthoate octaprenyltransferase [Bacteroidales bacterium]|nr:1,4-dihydroxy-2-naphthoate octaprenyltransferase [Bacteroidales bacterium]